MTSQQGGNVTMRIVNGDTYLNDAKVIATDYLVYNGVMHILEKPLNFSLPDAIPPPLLALSGGNTSTAFSNPPSQAKSTLPIGTKVGIALVVAITVFGIIGIAIYFYRQYTGRGRKEYLNELSGEYKVEKVHEIGIS
ncbi:putative mitochondrial transport protein [Venturia nashicola]|nr:putative mitochondrial transport protein [Venturia nashicola]